jgi:hypothetical protein
VVFEVLNKQELNQLEDELPRLISDRADIERAIVQAQMEPSFLHSNATTRQLWHEAVRHAALHGKLPLLLARIRVQLGDRLDANELRRLIAAATERNIAAMLAEEVQQLKTKADDMLGQPDSAIAIRAALDHLRPPIRQIHQRLYDQKFWPTLFPGLSSEEAQVSRDQIADRCLDALRTVDVLIGLGKIAGAAPSSDADDRDRWRLAQAQMQATVDAKFAMLRAVRALHQELVWRLPFATGSGE